MTLKVNDLRFSYRRRSVLEGIDIEAAPGALVAILGENGAGKTTLLRSMNRILKPQQGSVLVDDKFVAAMP